MQHAELRRSASSKEQAADRKAVGYRAPVSWILPTPLLLFAGVVALLPLAVLVRRSTPAPRLVAEAFVTGLAVIAAVWAARVLLWLIERRW